jgi:hypothetical protein
MVTASLSVLRRKPDSITFVESKRGWIAPVAARVPAGALGVFTTGTTPVWRHTDGIQKDERIRVACAVARRSE